MRLWLVVLLDLVLFGAFIDAQNPALEWPVEKDKKYQISSTFGESRLDHFHNGIDLPGEGFKVLSPRDARLLYRINAEAIPGEMPFGGGNTIVLDHGDVIAQGRAEQIQNDEKVIAAYLGTSEDEVSL